MAQIKFIDRTGKDLFEYMKFAVVNEDRATEQAIEKFVLLDELPMILDIYLKLKPKYKDMIKGSLFPMKTPDSYESDDSEVTYIDELSGQGYSIKKKKIKSSLLTEIQTMFATQTKKGMRQNIESLKNALILMFDTTLTEIDTLPFPLVVGLINEMNNFLSESTRLKDVINVEFDDELFIDNESIKPLS